MDGGLDRVLLPALHLVPDLGHGLAGGVDHVVRMVAGRDQLVQAPILLRVGLGVLHHLGDLVVREPGGGLDDDGLLLAGRLVLGGDVEDAVGVDVELDLDLGDAARGRRDVGEVEPPQGLVVHRPLALALEDVHGHRSLVVVGRREDLLGGGRDGRVLLDQLGHDPAQGLDAERQGGHVQEQHVLDLAPQHAALDGGPDGDRLVGVHVLARGLAEEALHLGLDLGHPGLAAHQDDLVDLTRGESGILERDAAGLDGAVDEVLHQGLELGPGELDVEVLRPGLVGRDVGQVDVRLLAGAELDLGLLRRLLQPLQGQGVVVQVDALGLLELGREELDDPQVEVLAAEEGVPVGGQHLELVLPLDLRDLDDGDVEGAAAQVEDRDLLIAALLVHAVGQGRGGGLVDDALDVEAGDAPGVLGRLALGVVEVGGHRDDRLADGAAEVVLGRLLHLLEDLGRDLRGGHLASVDLHPGVPVVRLDDLVGHHPLVLRDHLVVIAAADQTLDGEQGVLRVGDRLALRGLAHHDLVVTGVGDDGGRGAVALGVLDDLDAVALHDGHTGVGGAKVDTDDLSHLVSPNYLVWAARGCRRFGRRIAP